MNLPKKLIKLFAVIALFTASFLILRESASAATITVSGGCSYENAIASANGDADTGGCVGSGTYGTDTISIPAGTFTLTSTPMISDDLTIEGQGSGVTVLDGDNTENAIYCVSSPAGTNLTVSNLTVTKTAGGGIGGFDCNITASNIEITNISGVGVMFIAGQDSNTLSLNLTDIHIHNNQLQMGIITTIDPVLGNITINSDIKNLTINNNSLLAPSPYFNGIVTNPKGGTGNTINMNLENSTISNGGDSIGVLAASISGTSVNTNLINNTIVGNSQNVAPTAGGIIASADGTGQSIMTVQNTLLSDNESSAGNANCASSGTGTAAINSVGNNLSNDSSCNFSSTGDLENITSISSTLGPLQDNGGNTPTIALLNGSPAIDAGATVGTITTDQRGVARPQGSAYDIGAYETAGGDQNNQSSDNSSEEMLADTGTNTNLIYLTALISILLGILAPIVKKSRV